MSLRVWLPLTKDLRQQGLSNVTVTNNGATFNSAGKLGGCYYFNATSQSINLTNYMTTLKTFNNYSMSAWVYIETKASDHSASILSSGNWNQATGQLVFGFYSWSTDHYTKLLVPNISGWSNGISYNFMQNTWYHITITYNGSKTLAYVNGTKIGEYNGGGIATTSETNNLYVGCATYYGSFNLRGKLNDIRIYDHCLSPMEVKQLSQGLVLHYPLNRQGWGQENLITNSQVNGSWTYPSSSYSDKYSPTTTIVPSGSVYTLSFDAKSTVAGDRIVTHYYSPNTTTGVITSQGYTSSAVDGYAPFTLTTDWQRYWVTYTQSSTTAVKHLICPRLTSGNGTGTVSVRNVKFEEGDKPTPWCPNSSDALATTIGLNSTTEYDCSGFCNNGTRTGTFTWTSDTPKYNISTYMPKAALITHPRPVFGGTDQEWTCAMWVKLDDLSSSQMLNNFNRGNYLTTGTNALLYLNDGTNDYYNYANTKLTAGVWTHVVFVFKNTNVIKRIYFNGVDKTNTSGPNKTSTPAGIPDTVTVGTNLAGYISDYRIYATALSATDVLALYQNSAYIDSSGNIYGSVFSEVS